MCRHVSCICVFCPFVPAWTHHLALLKEDHLNECQEAALSYMQLIVAVIAKDNCRQNNVHTKDRGWVIKRSGL